MKSIFPILVLLAGTPTAQEAAMVIENVTLIDGTGRPAVPGAFVLIRGERITRVRYRPIEVNRNVRRIDGSSKFLIPGLTDLHVHLAGSRGPGEPDPEVGIRALHGLLYAGVTTIYDPGNDPDYIFGLRERERSGTIESPRIFTSGAMLSAPGGHGTFKLSIQSWPQDLTKIDAHLARKPDLVKIMFDELGWGTRPTIPKISPELLETLVEYYNDRGIRTTSQASSETQAREAIFAGIDTLSHPVIQGPVSESFVRLMAAKKIPMVSTIAIGENYARLAEQPEFLDQPLYRALFEPEEIARLKTEVRQQYQESAWTWWMDVMTPIAQETLRRIHEAGGIVALGSDQSNGAATHRELELLVEAGIAPLDVIRIGTLNAATYLGREDEMGSIEEGKIADLVLLDADPTVDIDNTKRVHLVIKGGRIIDRSSLDLPVNR